MHQNRAISGVNLRRAASSPIKFYVDFGKIMKFCAGFRHGDFGKIVKFYVEFRREFYVAAKSCIEFRQGQDDKISAEFYEKLKFACY